MRTAPSKAEIVRAALRKTPNATSRELKDRLGFNHATVCNAIAQAKMVPASTTIRTNPNSATSRVAAALEANPKATARQLSIELGIPETTVRTAAYQRGISLARLNDSQHQAGTPAGYQRIKVPAWAMLAGLAEDYRDYAASHGEHEAARMCRRLKQEAAR